MYSIYSVYNCIDNLNKAMVVVVHNTLHNIVHRRNAYVSPIQKKVAGDQPKDLNAKTFAPNAGNIRQKKKHLKF